MGKQMENTDFAKHVLRYVKNALPYELSGAGVFIARLDTGEGAARVALLISRPWNSTATVFYLDGWYRKYLNGAATAESAAAAIINDRRLYIAW